jgi:hypothetical protein
MGRKEDYKVRLRPTLTPHLITAALTFVVRSLTTFITSHQASSAAAASAIAAAGGTTHTPLHHGAVQSNLIHKSAS